MSFHKIINKKPFFFNIGFSGLQVYRGDLSIEWFTPFDFKIKMIVDIENGRGNDTYCSLGELEFSRIDGKYIYEFNYDSQQLFHHTMFCKENFANYSISNVLIKTFSSELKILVPDFNDSNNIFNYHEDQPHVVFKNKHGISKAKFSTLFPWDDYGISTYYLEIIENIDEFDAVKASKFNLSLYSLFLSQKIKINGKLTALELDTEIYNTVSKFCLLNKAKENKVTDYIIPIFKINGYDFRPINNFDAQFHVETDFKYIGGETLGVIFYDDMPSVNISFMFDNVYSSEHSFSGRKGLRPLHQITANINKDIKFL